MQYSDKICAYFVNQKTRLCVCQCIEIIFPPAAPAVDLSFFVSSVFVEAKNNDSSPSHSGKMISVSLFLSLRKIDLFQHLRFYPLLWKKGVAISSS